MIERNESDNNLCKLLLFHKMILRERFAKQTFYLMIIWCKIHVIYGFFTTETTILPQPWVGFEYHKSTGKSPRNEQKVWKICFFFYQFTRLAEYSVEVSTFDSFHRLDFF